MKPITGFLDECCLLARNARYPAVELYLIYVQWCVQNSVPVQDQFTFLDVLECYGLKYREKKNKSWLKGVSVLPKYRMETSE
jgi:phage/plasmid-associated DNA primase